MSTKLLVITEDSDGQYECRGENYRAIAVFDLDVLNQISKEHIIKNDLQKIWSKKHGVEIEPMNEVDWSWEDLHEEIDCMEKYRNEEDSYFSREMYTLDLSLTFSIMGKERLVRPLSV